MATTDGEEISFEEARGRLGVHSATLRQWVADGRISARELPDGRLVFRLAVVERRRRGDAGDE
jgi:predicted site-specific integrase-resolvase